MINVGHYLRSFARSFAFNALNLRGPLHDIYSLHITQDSVLGRLFPKGNLNNSAGDRPAESREAMEERDELC